MFGKMRYGEHKMGTVSVTSFTYECEALQNRVI
jgi:hypothetical protein